VADDLRGDGCALRRQVGLAVAPEHEDRRLEGLPLGRRDAIDEEALALAHTVLLAAD
jgi:hypothetical protein